MDRLAYRINDIIKVTGIGRAHIRTAIDTGALPARKLGISGVIILAGDLQEWLATLERKEVVREDKATIMQEIKAIQKAFKQGVK